MCREAHESHLRVLPGHSINGIKMKKFLLWPALALCVAHNAGAGEGIEFSYADLNETCVYLGTSQTETYDIAIHLDGERFAGKSLTSVRVPVRGDSDISGCRVWLSKSLNASVQAGKSLNSPDILSVPAKLKDGFLSVSLPERFEIPEGGVYVGYTFSADVTAEGGEASAPVAGVRPAAADGFYVHTSKSYPVWRDGGAEWGIASVLSVGIEGDFSAIEMSLLPDAGEYNVKAGESVLPVNVKVVSCGTGPICEMDFSYTANGKEQTYRFEPAEPLKLQWGIPSDVEMWLPVDLPKGPHKVTLRLDRVNGVAQTGESLVAEAGVDALEYVPEHRPLMEEYTGLWCGACPRGLAAMQYMEKKWPGRFIAMSYHNDDEMSVMESGAYPYTVPSLPAAWFDRERKVDPYLGVRTSGFGLEDAWLEASSRFTPADVSVTASWSDEAHTIVNVKADVRFVKAHHSACRMEYTLLADGLSESDWRQKNYYSGQSGYDELEEMKPFVQGDLMVLDVVFDGVVAATSRVVDDVPVVFTPVPDTDMDFAYSFDAHKAVSLTGYDMAGEAQGAACGGFGGRCRHRLCAELVGNRGR